MTHFVSMEVDTMKDSILYDIQIGYETDIGGGRENQDDSFIWKSKTDHFVVIGVLDGHGREVGKIAAQSAKQGFIDYFDKYQADFQASRPDQFLTDAFCAAHQAIKDAFRKELTYQGYVISEDSSGYLLKRRSTTLNWSCVHGGTSCSLLLIHGHCMYIANVGDSSGLICVDRPILNQSLVEYIVDGAISADSLLKPLVDSSCLSKYVMLTAEHSPESIYEFRRLREYRCRDDNPYLPSLIIAYDAPNCEKINCPPVFSLGENDEIKVINKGKYYKNVRKEWASLVSTPSSAKFQDALAFTRSLGDLHLHTYGVTHLPEIQSLDVSKVFEKLSTSNADPTNNTQLATEQESSIACIVLASDGVWDNWLYEDVASFVMDPSCLKVVRESNDGCKKVAMSFMHRNAIYSKKNFGSQADNATCVVLYIIQKSSLR